MIKNNLKYNMVVGDSVDGISVVYYLSDGQLGKELLRDDGIIIIFSPYSRFGDFYDGLAWFEDHKKVGYINREGRTVITPAYIECEDFSEGYAFAYDIFPSLINTVGEEITTFIDEHVITTEFREGLSRVGLYSDDMNFRTDGFINYEGDLVIPYTYRSEIRSPFDLIDENDHFSEGLARVMIDRKYGYIDKNGDLIIDAQYDSASKFTFGLAAVSKNGKAGFIDDNGNEVVDLVYKDAGFSFNGNLFVRNSSNWNIINYEGKVIEKHSFDDVKFINSKISAVKKNGKWGLLNSDYDFVFPCIADFPPFYHEGIYRYVINGRIAVRDLHDNELISDEIYRFPLSMAN